MATTHNAQTVKTLAPSTEANYLKQAIWFEMHTARNLGIDNPGPLVVAAYALERREEWSKSTWRQNKAALIFRYGCMGTDDALAAVHQLQGGSQSVCATKTGKTSARRAKHVTVKAFAHLIAAVQASGSRYASLLASWLILGSKVGLRPHEWSQAEVVRLNPAEVGDSEDLEPGAAPTASAPYLRIRNAKATNGRSHGEFRHLNLTKMDPGLVEMVAEFASLMTDATESGLYPLYYSSCRKLLWRLNKAIHGNKEEKWIQLYSPRHKFSSDAKKALGAEGVAAVMGHGTTKTASEHYGRRSSATGSLGLAPVASEVIRVRKMRGYNARREAASSMPTPSKTPAKVK